MQAWHSMDAYVCLQYCWLLVAVAGSILALAALS